MASQREREKGGRGRETVIKSYSSSHPHRANDAPYGRFILQNPSITVDQSAPSIIARNLLYTITRESGAIGDVMIDVTTTYNPVRVRSACTLSKHDCMCMFQLTGSYCSVCG